jgi:hypothetical protein
MCEKYIMEVLTKSWWRTNNIQRDYFQLATKNRWISRLRVSSNLMFVSLNSNTKDVTCRAETANPSENLFDL